MFKALMKKQLMEVNTWLFQSRKTGKRRSSGKMVAMLLLYIGLFGMLGMFFFGMSVSLCQPLTSQGLGWVYFAIMGLMAIVLGIFGSVFNTFTTLYKAKDNEFLLAMPIPASYILFVRLVGVWMWSLIYEALVFIPAMVTYWILGGAGPLAVVFEILILLLISFFVLTLSCILGWAVAKVSERVKNKSAVTVILSLLFFAVYYVVYFRLNSILQGILLNAEEISRNIKGFLYPIYLLGRAAEGKVLPLIAVIAMVGVLFAVVYIVMSRSFLKMATTSPVHIRRKLKGTEYRQSSKEKTLFLKELKRYTESSTYMLNCGLASVLMPIGAIALIVFGRRLTGQIEMLGISGGLVAMMVTGALCMMASMNDITAPSISLEGKHIWIVQSMPIDPWEVLKAKLKLHIWMTEIPLLLCAAASVFVFRPGLLGGFVIFLIPTLFVFFGAGFGLVINLKAPNLSWTTEAVPIKQSMSVLLAIFGGWGVVIIPGLIYLPCSLLMDAKIYLLVCAFLLIAANAVLFRWLKTRGSRIFADLTV